MRADGGFCLDFLSSQTFLIGFLMKTFKMLQMSSLHAFFCSLSLHSLEDFAGFWMFDVGSLQLILLQMSKVCISFMNRLTELSIPCNKMCQNINFPNPFGKFLYFSLFLPLLFGNFFLYTFFSKLSVQED